MRFLIVILAVLAVAVAAVQGVNMAVASWAADQQQRSELVRSYGSWDPPPQEGVTYVIPTVVPDPHPRREVGR